MPSTFTGQSSIHPPPAETELIRLLRQRQESAFAELYSRYAGALYSIVLKIVKEETLAEDVLQEAFVKVWHRFGDYEEGKGRLFTWLLNVTRNLAIDRIRSAPFRRRSLTQPLSDATDVGVQPPEWMALDNLFPHLRPEERLLIELVYYQGFSGPDAARHLAIPLGTVKTRLRAALAKLRSGVNRETWTEEPGAMPLA